MYVGSRIEYTSFCDDPMCLSESRLSNSLNENSGIYPLEENPLGE